MLLGCGPDVMVQMLEPNLKDTMKARRSYDMIGTAWPPIDIDAIQYVAYGDAHTRVQAHENLRSTSTEPHAQNATVP
jgi:hypothetical protein